ncbi:hypothetical protein [Caudoviricetes sp.]|nr:hypothetical protein [Caudoviricetes sp.]
MSMFTPANINAAGTALNIFGSINSAIGAYYGAESAKNQLRSQSLTLQYQSQMGEINARLVEAQAQQIMRAGQQRQQQIGFQAGAVVAASRASMAARGLTLTEGNAKEVVATTNLMKEIDLNTVNANAVRAAAAERMKKVGIENKSILDNISANNLSAMASGINPFMAMSTSLLGSAGNLANTWFSNYRAQQAGAASAPFMNPPGRNP